MLIRTSLLTLTIAVAIQALLTVVATVNARADSTTVFSCVGAGGWWSDTHTCVKIRRHGLGPNDVRPMTAEEKAEADERDRKWVSRCKPVLRQDHYGVSRYHYAARGCEFGKFEE